MSDRDYTFSTDPDLRAYAAHLRGEASGWSGPREVGHRRTCRSCGRDTIRELEDGECASCLESPDEAWERRSAERARAIQRGREQTAAMLRRMGYPERAAIHEGGK